MTDVFISYSGKDEEQAIKVHTLLTTYGIKTFLAGISLEPGANWSAEIFDNLKKSQGRRGQPLKKDRSDRKRDVGSETTYLHLKAYRCVIPQSCGLKILGRRYVNYT